MNSFLTLFNSLSPDSNLKGKQFEIIAKWFLENDPVWQTEIDTVWLWDDYPDKWSSIERGVDLVCLCKDGTHWAVQAKCYRPDNALKKADIDSFLSESNRTQISKRILIATTNKLGPGAEQVFKAQPDKPVFIDLHCLENSKLEFPACFEDLCQIQPVEKPTPRPHQIEAIHAVVQGLAIADKGQLIMACGTGKTFTSLWIREALQVENTLVENTLVLLPSLGLLAQTLKEWCFAKKHDFRVKCVCSDVSVNPNDDEAISHTLDIRVVG